MKYQGQSALVLGMGRSGKSVAELLLREGARVTVYDRNPDCYDGLDARVHRAPSEQTPSFEAFDFVVASPGFPVNADAKLRPEVDIAAAFIHGSVIGVTGTNGKSTTSVLIYEMLKTDGKQTLVGGNLGIPLSDLTQQAADFVVAELSSFQLEFAHTLHLDVAVALNLTPDHLDRHGSLEAYAAAKARIAKLQTESDHLVFNADDPWADAIAKDAIAMTHRFSAMRPLDHGACIDANRFLIRDQGNEILSLPLEDLSPAARSPVSNALAAALAAYVLGVSADSIKQTLLEFDGLAHRSQLVCTRDGVRFVNDSKATNPAAALASVNAQPPPVVALFGGRNKGLDFEPLRGTADRLRAAILFGESAADLELCLGGRITTVETDSLEAAVAAAVARAESGDTVLLAPACTSFDAYRSFEERGEHFAALVRALPESRPC